MENQQGNGEKPKKVKVLSTSSNSLQINEQVMTGLVGSIVEKGITDSQTNSTPLHSFPKPTRLPFPVARHRSHGPVSALCSPSSTTLLDTLFIVKLLLSMLCCIMVEFDENEDVL